MIDMQRLIGSVDIVFITFDALRWDAAQAALANHMIPNIGKRLPAHRWQKRHTPATFTYPAHHAFFSGFLPTPITPGQHPRLFASRFAASRTVSKQTFVFEELTLPQALAARAYRTICIGGVAFFNQRSALGSVLPAYFQEQYWHPSFSPTSVHSSERQIACALKQLAASSTEQRIFLFINISATHPPSHIFAPDAQQDSVNTQMAALAYADTQLKILFSALENRNNCLIILCSDHGTAFGEDHYQGHRLVHDTVCNVPYAEFVQEVLA